MFERVTILDGGLSNELQARGCDLSDDLWSARLLRDDPDQLVAAHRSYVTAGAEVVITASYQASFEGFGDAGIDPGEAERLMRLSVSCARRAAGGEALVAASIGPYGATLADGSEYTGRYGLSVAQLRAWHERRLEVLAGSGADVLAVETIPDLDEARAVLSLIRGSGVPAWVSYAVDGPTTRAGQPLAGAFALVRDVPEIVAVGVNCSAPRDVLGAVAVAARTTGLPAVAYPNSGETWDAGRRSWSGRREPLVDLAPAWIEAGARAVGGCCRVGPDQIAGLASLRRDT